MRNVLWVVVLCAIAFSACSGSSRSAQRTTDREPSGSAGYRAAPAGGDQDAGSGSGNSGDASGIKPGTPTFVPVRAPAASDGAVTEEEPAGSEAADKQDDTGVPAPGQGTAAGRSRDVVAVGRSERPNPDTRAQDNAAGSESGGRRNLETSASTTASSGADRSSVPESPGPVPESRPLLQSDQLLGARGGSTIGPEDFEIGRLEVTIGDAELKAVSSAVNRFQRSLAAGSFPEDSVDPEWRDALYRSLIYHLDRDHIPMDVRVGGIDMYVPARARVSVRLYGRNGWAVGDVYLAKNKGTWYVEDLQADLSQLEEPRSRRHTEFEPSYYSDIGSSR